VSLLRHDGVTVTPKAGGAPEEFTARTVLWTAGSKPVKHLAGSQGERVFLVSYFDLKNPGRGDAPGRP
jgi:hypothetical protein